MSPAFRCAAASLAIDEPLAGTASTVRAFLLLEQTGPWGEDALRQSRLPGSLGADIARTCRRHGVRPLLIRRHGRSNSDVVRCFTAYTSNAGSWVETVALPKPSDVLDLDLAALGRGVTTGLDPHNEPLFLACTHGRHDVCCAELGRPLAAALAARYPGQTWECSHIGGDRFAGNVLVLPDGLYYGRADATSGPAIAAAHLAGELDLDHLRGRTSLRFATQAAEWHLRRRLGVTAIAAVRLAGESVDGDVTTAVFESDGLQWRVRVRCTHAEPTQLTCKSAGPRAALHFRLLSIDQL